MYSDFILLHFNYLPFLTLLVFQKKRLLNKLPAAPLPDGFNPKNLVNADAPIIPFSLSKSPFCKGLNLDR